MNISSMAVALAGISFMLTVIWGSPLTRVLRYFRIPLTAVPDTAKARTVSFALGFHVVAAPVVASRAAINLRVCPPIRMKSPPAYIVMLDTAKTRTVLLALGFQAGSSLPLGRIWAILLRATVPTLVKAPPIYQPPAPSETQLFTVPFTLA